METTNGFPSENNIIINIPGGIAVSGEKIIYKGFWLLIKGFNSELADDVIETIHSANKRSVKLEIDGNTGYKRSLLVKEDTYEGKTVWVDIIKGKKHYSLLARYLANNNHYDNLFDQILSTFRFLD